MTVRGRARPWVVGVGVTLLVTGCARAPATVMAMRDTTPAEQERDHRECERQAGQPSLVTPFAGALGGKLIGTALGAAAGGLLAMQAVGTTNEPSEVGFTIFAGAAVGAAVGFVAGTLVGFKAGVKEARAEYLQAYARCMRERGYTVSPG